MLVILQVMIREVDNSNHRKVHHILYKEESLLAEPQLDTSLILLPGNRHFFINEITQNLVINKIVVTYYHDFDYRDAFIDKHEQACQEYIAEGWTREMPM